MSAKSHSSSRRSVIVKHFQFLPLLTQINPEKKIENINHIRNRKEIARNTLPNICSCNCQIRSALIKAEILYLISFIQLQCFEVL